MTTKKKVNKKEKKIKKENCFLCLCWCSSACKKGKMKVADCHCPNHYLTHGEYMREVAKRWSIHINPSK